MAATRHGEAAPPGPPPGSAAGRRRLVSWPVAQPWVSLTVRLVLGGVALAAGVAKIRDLPGSVRAVRAYDLLPGALAELVGYALPVVEIVLGVLLVAGLLTRWAALANAVLMAGFVVGVASAWARGLSIDCGCFGGGGAVDPEETQYVSVLVRDGALLLASVYLVRWPRSRLSADSALRL